ncbi:MAG: hypothetical protein Q4G02_00370 [bacterium]|nr:hypothetical protein [bacterium]
MFSTRFRSCPIELKESVPNYNQALIYLSAEIQKAYGFFLYQSIYNLQRDHGLTNQDIIKAFGFTRQNLSKLAKKYRHYFV